MNSKKFRTFYSIALYVSISFNFQVLYSQSANQFGFRHFQYLFEGDTLEVIVRSRKGEENIPKPIFFAVQGSRAMPLIVHNGERRTRYASLEEGFVEDDYHLVMVNKPGIPLIVHEDLVSDRGEYFANPKENIYTKKYIENNNLNYYVRSNISVIDSLWNESWVDTTRLVISGHSQGSSVAVHIADRSKKVTHLIYSSGLPYYSTILAIVSRDRIYETNEANPRIEKFFKIWESIIQNPDDISSTNRDTNRTLFSFSQCENEVLKRLKIPVLNSYGTKDESAPFHDLFRIETIRERLGHIRFQPYVGLGHNYQVTNPQGEERTDYLKSVVNDWMDWLKDN